jgi:hyaluronan synthase
MEFSEVYNSPMDTIAEAVHSSRRYSLIARELDRLTKNMTVRNDKKRMRWNTAFWIIVPGVCLLLSYRLIQEIFLIDPLLGIYGSIVGFMIFTSFFFSYVRYRDPSKNKILIREPLVSVVIAVKNDPYIISDSINSCIYSSYKNLEVIVVNDGSNDKGKTEKAIDTIMSTSERIKSVHLIKNVGKRKAIREGIGQKARGEVLILLDSDTIVERDAIARLVVCIVNNDRLGAVVGYCRPLNPDVNKLTKAEDTWYHGAFVIGKGMEAALGTVTCCSGTLSAYRMESVLPILEEWANDHFLGVEFKPGDDRQLTAMVLKQGWKTTYCESAISISEIPTTFRKLINQQIRWKKSWVRVFCYTAPFYYKNRNPISAVYYYLQMGISFVAPLIALRNLVIIPLSGGGWDSAILYISGLIALSLLFGIDYKLYNPGTKQRWMWRIGITLLSVNVLHWLLYYALLTMRRTSWLTR